MTFWFEQLERLRKEQGSDIGRSQIQLELPVPPPLERGEVTNGKSEHGVVIIERDEDEEGDGVIIISL